ncbi:MAG: glycogen synthase [Myxococcales bacterium]|nr:glycogen synthase [Myxococcales bacterium]
MRILSVSSECEPFSKTGGLAEVCRDLPLALARRGHDVRVLTPWYPQVPSSLGAREVSRHRCDFGGPKPFALGEAPFGAVRAFFIRSPLIPGLSEDERTASTDRYGKTREHERFWFFCSAAAALLDDWDWSPQVVLCHDYWSALLLPMLAPRPRRSRLVLVVHNAHLQGSFDSSKLPARLRDTGEGALPRVGSRRGRLLNFLRRGAMAADLLVAVSPTYAKELLTEERGEGLQDVFRARRRRLFGVLNGIDTERFDPATDPLIAARFDSRALPARASNKRALQRLAGLPEADVPLLAMVSRLDPQKGFLLLFRTLAPLLSQGVQLAICGDGYPWVRKLLEQLARQSSRQLSYLPFAKERETLYYAGADIFLMPSWWEPCGLGQMKAMRYGAVPLVRETGGLADTVEDYRPRTGTGFIFGELDPWALYTAVLRALATYQRPSEWRRLQRAAMRRDFSWRRAAQRYEELLMPLVRPPSGRGSRLDR